MEYNNQSSPSTFTLADPVQRLIAGFIDNMISFGIHWSLFMVLGWFGGAIGLLLAIAYLLVRDALPYTNGKSVGKMVMGLRAVTEKEHFPLTNNYEVSALRSAFLCIPILNIVEAVVSFSDERKRFGDKLAKTIVITSKD